MLQIRYFVFRFSQPQRLTGTIFFSQSFFAFGFLENFLIEGNLGNCNFFFLIIKIISCDLLVLNTESE